MARVRRRGATLRDVARVAGVSVSTASRAVNGAPYVREEVLERVRSAVDQTGYYPNSAARALKAQRTMTVGVVLQDLNSTVLMDLLNGLVRVADEQDYSLMMTSAAGDLDRYKRHLQRFVARGVDAIVLQDPRGVAAEVATCQQRGLPVIAIVGRGPDCGSVPLVEASGMDATREAARRISELGHNNVGLIGSGRVTESLLARQLGEAIETAGLKFRVEELDDAGHEDESQVALALHRLLSGQRPASVIFAMQRQVPVLLGELERCGLHVPDDVSICSITDSSANLALRPQVTSLSVRAVDLGVAMAKTLFDWLDGTEPALNTSVDLTSWVERESLAPLLERRARTFPM
ncbi:MAG: LacI family DNA-binding transcriptional regulator [Gemmatimonadota bacterium]